MKTQIRCRNNNVICRPLFRGYPIICKQIHLSPQLRLKHNSEVNRAVKSLNAGCSKIIAWLIYSEWSGKIVFIFSIPTTTNPRPWPHHKRSRKFPTQCESLLLAGNFLNDHYQPNACKGEVAKYWKMCVWCSPFGYYLSSSYLSLPLSSPPDYHALPSFLLFPLNLPGKKK